MNISDRCDEYLENLLSGGRAACRQIASELLEAGVPVPGPLRGPVWRFRIPGGPTVAE